LDSLGREGLATYFIPEAVRAARRPVPRSPTRGRVLRARAARRVRGEGAVPARPAGRAGAAVPGAGRHERGRPVGEGRGGRLAALIDEHRQAVARFGEDTRDGTLERAAEKIRSTQFKISAYAEYLLDAKAGLDRELAAARAELRAKVEQLATAPALA
jgi:hypothetical protein